MAYLRSIEEKCRQCQRRATMILFNRYNGEMGKYCKTCAAGALRNLQKAEDGDRVIGRQKLEPFR